MTSFRQISEERFQVLTSRFKAFLQRLDKPEEEPIRVFDPLTKKQIEELNLIREVSLDLQKKKEEDKAAQLAKQKAAEEEEAANKAKKAEASEETPEEASDKTSEEAEKKTE